MPRDEEKCHFPRSQHPREPLINRGYFLTGQGPATERNYPSTHPAVFLVCRHDPSLLLFLHWRVAYRALVSFRAYLAYFATYFLSYLRHMDLA